MTTITTRVTITTCQGGLLSPIYRLLFGATVTEETIVTSSLCVKEDLFEWELLDEELEEELLALTN